jgi:3-oxoacyl-[acyl-carrier protein] reductase
MNKLILQNKNCFITGATGGIGKEISIKLLECGCNLFLTSQNEKKMKVLVKNLQKSNKESTIFFKSGDLTKNKDIKKIILESYKKISNIDILINCAGLFPVKQVKNTTIKDFDDCFDVNIKAAFIFSKEFSKEMIQKKWGRIVNIGSSSSYNGFKNTSIYCASKHAMLGFSKSIDEEFRKYGIRTFTVSPGSVKTKMGKKVKNQNYETFIDPKEIADFIVNIISYDNEMIANEIRLNRMNMK